MPVTCLGSIGNFVKKSFSAGATGASALDYGVQTLELQAFLMKAKVMSEAIKDSNTREVLNNYVISENDSESIKSFVESMRLHNQSTNSATTVASNLTRH